MRFRTQFSEVPNPVDLSEFNDEPSMTVPDQAMSIQEIMHRHVRGLPVPKNSKMFYGGDKLYPPVHAMSHMDITDAQRMLQSQMETKDKELDDKRKRRKESIAKSKAEKLAKASAVEAPADSPATAE